MAPVANSVGWVARARQPKGRWLPNARRYRQTAETLRLPPPLSFTSW